MRTAIGSLGVSLTLFFPVAGASAGDAVRRLPVKEYRDKMKAGWIGQIIGVSWGAPTEGRYREIMPADKMPPFTEDLANHAFGQDDLYVEMTFLRTMEEYGFDASIRQAGIDFANSRYSLWVANAAGRNNLRNGIAPPDSSHPQFHNCAGAIDYQIEADYAGLIAPGMPDIVVALGEKFGRLMNYGDGVYAGQFMGVLYAEAFFETDVTKLIEAGLRWIPSESMYAEMVRDMLAWRRQYPDAWEKTWDLVDKKYRKDKNYYVSALDVKLEGAFVLMGLLYGGGDPDRTIVISCRCGSDSDCNPSSSGGVLCTALGMSKIPPGYHRKLDETKVFSYTAYDFPGLIAASEKLARQAVVRAGGRIEKDASGEDVFVIPVKAPKPSAFEDIKKPGPIAGSRFTPEEMARIRTPGLAWALSEKFPGWQLLPAGQASGSFSWERDGKVNVLELRAPGKGTAGWTLARTLEVPAGKKTRLAFAAGDARGGDWNLAVKAGGEEIVRKSIGKGSAPDPSDSWIAVTADLSSHAGKTIALEITGTPVAEKDKPPCLVTDLAIISD